MQLWLVHFHDDFENGLILNGKTNDCANFLKSSEFNLIGPFPRLGCPIEPFFGHSFYVAAPRRLVFCMLIRILISHNI